MALDWKNVVGQSTNAGTAALSNAGTLFDRAISGFEKVAREKQQDLVEQNTQGALDKIRKTKSNQDLAGLRDVLSTSVLNQQFGEGNIDTGAISRAMVAQEGKNTSKERKDTAYEQSQADRATKLARQTKADAQADFRFNELKKTIAREDVIRSLAEQADSIFSSIPSNFEIKENNDAVITTVLGDLRSNDPDYNEGDVQIDGSGEVTFGTDYPEEKQKQVVEKLKAAGMRPYLSYNERTELLANKFKSEGLDKYISKYKTQLATQAAASKLSAPEQADLASRISGIDNAAKREKALAQREYDLAMEDVSPVQTKSKEAEANEFSSFIDQIPKEYPDEVAGVLGFTDNSTYVGADQLTKLLGQLHNTGVNINGVMIPVETWMLKKHLVPNTVNPTDGSWLLDKSVNKDTFIKDIKADLVSESTQKKATVYKMDKFRELSKKLAEIDDKASTERKTLNKVFKKAKNITDTNRNVSIFARMSQGS